MPKNLKTSGENEAIHFFDNEGIGTFTTILKGVHLFGDDYFNICIYEVAICKINCNAS